MLASTCLHLISLAAHQDENIVSSSEPRMCKTSHLQTRGSAIVIDSTHCGPKFISSISGAAVGTGNSSSPGQMLEYVINYHNVGRGALTTIVISDATPAVRCRSISAQLR